MRYESSMPRRKMDRTFVRNFIIFVLILVGFAGWLIYGLIKSDRAISQTDKILLHTQDIITISERISSEVEGMVAAQRGYIITREKKFLENFRTRKNNVSEKIAYLSELTRDNKAQQSRLDELRLYFADFSTRLEERARLDTSVLKSDPLQGIEIINDIKDNITRLNRTILAEEYRLLNQRITLIELIKNEYLNSLVVGISIGTIMLLLLNAFLLSAQRKRTVAELSLKETEERFALAIEGTQEGIFDWDIKTGKIFYSRRFFEMLGYDHFAHLGTTEEAINLIHPEDKERVLAHADLYLDGNLSEYTQEFRMKHATGRWVWIQSRAKALYDLTGKAYRMVGTHSDISHIKQVQDKLTTEKNVAEEANQAKSEFLAHMSHEIRTPLTAIRGIAEIFERNQKNLDDKQRQLVNVLMSSASGLSDLIDDILDFSKIESGNLDLDKETFMLHEVFEGVISMMALKASEKGISFVFDYKDIKKTRFYGDAKRIRQILVNLVGNAIKFTSDGGVTIKAIEDIRETGKVLRIEITDTGIGIAPENFDLVFDRFKQADSSVSRKYGGTGLGLPISRNLARLMGGDIILQSQTGKGSTFSLILPFPENADTEVKSSSKGAILKLNKKIKETLSNVSKALIVEDYEGNIVVISYILDDLGIAYDVARNGLEAVNLWNAHHYHVILMDVQMPEMDGFTATKEIRHQEMLNNRSRTPIIGMTAHALVGDKDKCIEAGMDAYLPKPIVEADLKEEILKYLKEKKAS